MDSQPEMVRIARNQRLKARTGGNRPVLCRSRSVRILAILNAEVCAFAVLSGAYSSVDAAEATSDWQSIDEIAAAAEQSVIDLAGAAGASLTPVAGYIDSRLKLADCAEHLTTSLQSGSASSGRATVQVECTGERPWRIFVPVQIKVTDLVIVAGKSLASGHVLTPDDVLVEARDVTRLRSGYIGRPEDLVGKRLKRQLLPGRVITPSMLMERTMIERGQSVTISADSGGVSIETAGKALMDGALNERIQVENSGSKQVIEAIVRSPERVEVLVN
jgi:flagella basal body P-ring formation protein FlgA